jgi:hypothetical protein
MCGLLDRMVNSSGEKAGRERSEQGPHEEFLELCAVSTSGDLTDEEQEKLQAHLSGCAECRKALKEFEAAVDVGVPLLASKLSLVSSEGLADAQLPQKELAGSRSLKSEDSEPLEAKELVARNGEKRGFAFAGRYRYRPSQVNWTYVWMPFAACILLTVALGIYAYRVTNDRNIQVAHGISGSANGQIEALEQRISDAAHDREVLKTELAKRDQVIAELRHQTEQESKSLTEMKAAQANLEHSLQNDALDKQGVVDERAALSRKFEAAQASLQKMQSDLDSMSQQRALDAGRDASLQNQIKDLSTQLRAQGETVAKQDELLAHDRDIRDLMGARKLYVVDVYDVARDGSTQKSYGRVFYTKGKSLIFYAYDLDQEPGVRNASTFQAWGRRGPDKQQSLNLGIFYQDNASKKRWVLKFDDPKALDEIDAVFVTIEPNGGSQKPSGKPLLSAYLQVAPNHP